MIKDVLLALTSYPDPTSDASIEQALNLCVALDTHVTAVTFQAEVKLTRTTDVLSNMLLDIPLMLEEEKARSKANARHLLDTFSDTASRLHLPNAKVLDKCVAFQVPDALIELWQANAAGRYNHPEDQQDKPLDPRFRGFPWSKTHLWLVDDRCVPPDFHARDITL